MPNVESQDVQEVLDRLKDLRQRAEAGKSAAQVGTDTLTGLVASAQKDAAADADLKVDVVQWAALAPEEQRLRFRRLNRVLDAAIRLFDLDGPTDPRSIMYRQYLSNTGVVFLTLLALIGTTANLYAIYRNFESATGGRQVSTSPPPPGPAAITGATGSTGRSGVSGNTGTTGGTGLTKSAVQPAPATGPSETPGTSGAPPATGQPGSNPVKAGPREQDALIMVMLMGMLGGFLHLTSSLAKYVGNRNLLRSWVIYYLLMPVEGPALAVAIYLLFRVGVLNPSAANQNATDNLNWIGLYGFSVLAGIFSKQALEMLGNVFNTIFARVEGKDTITGSQKPKS